MSVRGGWLPVLAVGSAVTVAHVALPAGSVVEATLLVLLTLTAAILLAHRLVRDGLLSQRPWQCFLAATGLYAIATTVWGLWPLATGRELAFPSPLEALYVASHGFGIAFLAGVVRARYRGSQDALRAVAVAMVDAAILAIAVTAVLWPTLIAPNLEDPDLGVLPELVAVGHPLLTAVVLGLIVRLVISGRGARSAVPWLLLLWAGAELGGDVVAGYLSVTGGVFHGNLGSAVWTISHVALVALALHPDLPRLTEGDGSMPLVGWRLWLPLVAVLVPGIVALATGSALLQILAAAGVLLIIVRLRLMSGDLAEQRRLAAELAETTRQLEYQALHDPLTGLANRALFAEQLEQAWAQHRRHGRGLVVLALDLDGFKRVNDNHGHSAGDGLLVEAARRLRRSIRHGDTVARLGGDEFTILLPEASVADAEEVAQRVLRQLDAPLEIDETPLVVGTSIGIAAAGDRHRHPEELLRESDAALYAAKDAGKGRHEVYAPGIERATSLTLTEVCPAEAKAWAGYMRQLRLEIAERKLTGAIAGHTRAPENIHRTLQRVLAAIDRLDEDAQTAALVLPARRDVEEFVFHQTAVQHWTDALAARGDLSTHRPAGADRFWARLERVAAAVDV